MNIDEIINFIEKQQNYEIEAFDTETYKGNLMLLTSSKTFYDFEYIDDKEKFDHVLFFFLKNAKKVNFFFNISYDFSVLLKPYLISKREIYESVKEFKNDPEISDILKNKHFLYPYNNKKFLITFINNKAFFISELDKKGNTKRTMKFFDIANFFYDGNTHYSLDYLAKLYLNDQKNNEELGIDRRKIGSEEGYYHKNKTAIIKYGIKDAELTKKLAYLRLYDIYQFLHVIPSEFYSHASISREFLNLKSPEKYQYWKFLLMNQRYYDLHYYIINSYYGGIFLTKKLGYFENINQIDINSAYPYALSRLTSIIGAKVKYVKKPSPIDLNNYSIYGFYKVKIRLDGKIPIPYRINNQLIYPFSTNYIEKYITAHTYWELKNRNYDVEFIDGYEIYTKGNPAFPFIQELYEIRQKIKQKENPSEEEKSLQYLIKIILNSIYGLTAQSKPIYKGFTNFIYASYITDITRRKIWNMADKIGYENIIAIYTDSIIYQNKNQSIPLSKQLGDFSYKNQNSKGIFFMNGIYILDDELKKRGFKHLSIEDILNAKGEKLKILLTEIPKVLSSIIQDKIENIGDFIQIEKEINLKSNLNKYYFDADKLTFEYLLHNQLEGKPLNVVDNENFEQLNKENNQKLNRIMDTVIKLINLGEL